MVMPTFNLSIQEAKADGSLWIQAQPSLHSEVQATQSNIIRLPQKKKKNWKEKKIDFVLPLSNNKLPSSLIFKFRFI